MASSDLTRRLRSLAWGELCAAAVFASAAAFVIAPRFTAASSITALWVVLVPLLAILMQASVFWFLLLRRSPRAFTRRQALPFVVFAVLDPILLIATTVSVCANPPADPEAMVLCVIVWLFAAIEYVNYFVVRVSYPFASWASDVVRWRTPRLVRELRRAR